MFMFVVYFILIVTVDLDDCKVFSLSNKLIDTSLLNSDRTTLKPKQQANDKSDVIHERPA